VDAAADHIGAVDDLRIRTSTGRRLGRAGVQSAPQRQPARGNHAAGVYPNAKHGIVILTNVDGADVGRITTAFYAAINSSR
jgi:hypothetical protein